MHLKSQENNRLSADCLPSLSAGYKIHDLTLTPGQQRLAVGERLELICTANTELNVGIEFNWTHSGGALVSLMPACPPRTFGEITLETVVLEVLPLSCSFSLKYL